jgi:hypothetical protein
VTRQQLVDVALAHAAAEANGNLEATLATLEPDPVYELQPAGLVLRGMDNARAYYEYFFPNFLPTVESYEVRAEWVNDVGVAQEYVINVRPPDTQTVESHHLIGILVFGTTALAGERLYGSERIFRLLFGRVYDLAVPAS